MKVLIIEDDELSASALSFKLKENGHTVSLAVNGSNAVDIVMDNSFDLIICDLMMPIISGVTFLSMRENFISHEIPVIVMSSLGEGDEILKKLNINFEYFVKKPIQFEKLAALVTQIELNSMNNKMSKSSLDY